MSLGAVTNFFSSFPIDWLILFAFAAVASLTVLQGGAKRVTTLALAVPATILVSQLLPVAGIAGAFTRQIFTTPLMHAVLFLIILAVMYTLVAKLELERDDAGKPLQSLIAGCALTAILVAAWVATPALSALWSFGPGIQALFAESWRFWWLIGSFAALAFVRS